MTYEWREWTDCGPWLGLLPVSEANNYSLSRIASVYRRGDGMYVASYLYEQPDRGNKPKSWALHKTRRGAQRWLENQLARFWSPPEIVNETTT